ncbi:MAG TPA: hypothetical protein VIY86_00710 [Pirellulaceae bacterium]
MRGTISRVVGIIRLAEREQGLTLGDRLATVVYGRVPCSSDSRWTLPAARLPRRITANLAALSRELDVLYRRETERVS